MARRYDKPYSITPPNEVSRLTDAGLTVLRRSAAHSRHCRSSEKLGLGSQRSEGAWDGSPTNTMAGNLSQSSGLGTDEHFICGREPSPNAASVMSGHSLLQASSPILHHPQPRRCVSENEGQDAIQALESATHQLEGLPQEHHPETAIPKFSLPLADGDGVDDVRSSQSRASEQTSKGWMSRLLHQERQPNDDHFCAAHSRASKVQPSIQSPSGGQGHHVPVLEDNCPCRPVKMTHVQPSECLDCQQSSKAKQPLPHACEEAQDGVATTGGNSYSSPPGLFARLNPFAALLHKGSPAAGLSVPGYSGLNDTCSGHLGVPKVMPADKHGAASSVAEMLPEPSDPVRTRRSSNARY